MQVMRCLAVCCRHETSSIIRHTECKDCHSCTWHAWPLAAYNMRNRKPSSQERQNSLSVSTAWRSIASLQNKALTIWGNDGEMCSKICSKYTVRQGLQRRNCSKCQCLK